MGTAYEALRAVAHLDRADLDDRLAYEAARHAIEECRAKVQTFLKSPGLTGAAATAATQALNSFDKKLEVRVTEMNRTEGSFTTADHAVNIAQVEFKSLSPELISPWESAVIRAAGTVVLPPLGIVGAEYYLNQLEQQRDARRDAEAQRILDSMNSQLGRAVAELPKIGTASNPEPGVTPPEVGARETWVGPGSGGSSRDGGTGGGGGFRPPGVTLPPGDGITPPISPYPPIDGTPWKPPTEGPGSPVDPIGPGHEIQLPDLDDRQIGSRWRSDGPVGGYVPAPVLNADDPRWGANYRVAGFGDAAGGVGIAAGGLLGLGATGLAARAAGSALSGGAALAFGSATGSGNAAALAGAGGTQAAGAAGRVPGNGMLGGAPGGGAPGQDKKRRSGLVGYQVLRLDEEVPEAATPGLAGAAGSVAGLAPVTEIEEVDRW
ncbi:MAG: hypothetical protein IPM11_16155 [Micropruina sp.]|nr:hypothetical protein [Micropruina sp.]